LPTDSALLIVNGCAGGRRTLHDVDRIVAALSPRFHVRDFRPADEAGTRAAVRDAISMDARAVIVAGGDGTINRIASVLAGSGVPLGILPCGTANDFARALDIPIAIPDAISRILQAVDQPVDLVDVNGESFCTVGLLGVVADSAGTVIRLNAPGSPWRWLVRLLGPAAWRISGTLHLLRPAPLARHLRLTWTDPASGVERWIERDAIGCFLANTTRLGGGLDIPIDARPDDGVFEVCIVPSMRRTRLLYAFACFVYGWPLPEGSLVPLRARRATIELDGEGMCSADGELLCRGSRFELHVRPGDLRVFR
jgi:diacylglycerol kinase (ATP)